jgi:two-component system nitrogen regulation sensor histidine kinase NtrY
MRLAPRLVLAFGVIAVFSVAGLGYYVRRDRSENETRRFADQVRDKCSDVLSKLKQEGERDRKLVVAQCTSTASFVDTALTSTDPGHLLALREIVPGEAEAFGLQELMLATRDGVLLAESPLELQTTPRAEVAKLVTGDPENFALRLKPAPAIVVRCLKTDPHGRAVGLVGVKELAPVIEHLGDTSHLIVTLGTAPPAKGVTQTTCSLKDAAGTELPITVSQPQKELDDQLARIDQTVLYAGIAASLIALLLAAIIARSIGRPIAELAAEARKVASGEARPLRVRGSGEIADLALAFDKMLEDLAATRRRLAATSRVAAWREVARRVAHEVKNPLAPIRAAVETLRRLRARQDPAFDEYFDEATRTVLDEVHRISNIVTEFTRFARLPPPRPTEVDLMELTRQVVRLQEANARGAKLKVVVHRVPPTVRADRDQIVQVLTNLVQNALDAVEGQGEAGEVGVSLGTDDAGHASVTVTDNGPGIAPEIAGRLFEPYATTKQQGTGLGLAIAQRIAIEHNGELSYVGTPGTKGASFRLVLPVEGPAPVSASEGGAPSSG